MTTCLDNIKIQERMIIVANTNTRSILLNAIRNLGTNTLTDSGLLSNLTTPNPIGVNLPGVNVDVNLELGNLGLGNILNPSNTPTNLRELLNSLLNRTVEVTVPFQTLTGTLIAVRSDYIALVEADGTLVEVPINKIEAVQEVTNS